jgi:PAS domain-containing protein
MTNHTAQASFDWTPEHDRKLLDMQVAALYSFAPAMAASSFFGALLTLAVFFDDNQLNTGVLWFAYAICVVLFRIFVMVLYERRQEPNPRLWANLAIMGNLLAGIQWGLLGTFLFPAQSGYRELFAVMVITSYVGGSITAYAAVKWAHPALSIPAAMPAAVYLFFFHDGVHAAGGVAALFLVGATVAFAMKEHKLISNRLRLVIQNQDLMQRVQDVNAQLAKANSDLAHRAAVRLQSAQKAKGRVAMLTQHFKNAPLPMFECDQHLNLLAWNDAAERLLGERIHSLLGEPLLSALFEEVESEQPNAILRAARDKSASSLRGRFRGLDRKPVEAVFHITPLEGVDGVPGRVSLVLSELRSNGDIKAAA